MKGTGVVTRELARESVLAHRVAVQDLARPVRTAADCRVLDLGLQNTPPGSGLTGVQVRTGQSARQVTGLFDEGGPLAVVLAARGAPHVVARSELPLVTAALFPFDEQEAAEVSEVAQAMREVANGRAVSRPELSAALNDKVADSLRGWCERCGSRHVHEGLFRKATLQAGLELDASATAPTAPTVFRPSPRPSPRPSSTSAKVRRSVVPDREEARAELVRRYIHFTGVARPADLASWLGYQVGEIRAAWDLLAGEVIACDVAGKRRWALTSDLESLSRPPRPGAARLLPPSDPYLLGDRALVLPDRACQRQLWRALAGPGAILAGGEIVGTWRHQQSGGRLRLTLRPFHELDSRVLKDLEHDAGKIAALRGTRGADLSEEPPDTA